MSSLNKALLIGRVGKDPEVRYLPNGDAVANLSLATSEQWKDKNSGEKREKSEWHRLSFFGKLAEIVGQYVKKGQLLYVEGRIETREWTDKEGVKRYTTEIKADQMKMLSKGGGSSESSPSSDPASSGPAQSNDSFDQEIPF